MEKTRWNKELVESIYKLQILKLRIQNVFHENECVDFERVYNYFSKLRTTAGSNISPSFCCHYLLLLHIVYVQFRDLYFCNLKTIIMTIKQIWFFYSRLQYIWIRSSLPRIKYKDIQGQRKSEILSKLGRRICNIFWFWGFWVSNRGYQYFAHIWLSIMGLWPWTVRRLWMENSR